MTTVTTLKDVCGKCDFGNSPLGNASVYMLKPNREGNALDILLRSASILHSNQIASAEEGIARAYALQNVQIRVKYNISELSDDVLCYCKNELARKYSSVEAAFRVSKITAKEHKIIVEAPEQWVERMKSLERDIAEFMNCELGIIAPIEIVSAKNEDKADFERARDSELESAKKRCAEEAAHAANSPRATQPVQERKWEKKKADGPIFQPKSDGGETLYGKAAARAISKMEDISDDSGKVAVRGEVFFVDSRQLNGKDKTIVTFDMNDASGAVRCVRILSDDEAKRLIESVKPGMYCMVQGVTSYSMWEKDTVITPSAIVTAEPVLRNDMAENKRVELHLHTCMSAMDGLCSTAEVVKTAARWGHKAIAITDHGVAQAFPDAMHAAEKLAEKGKDIKIIYGVEAYCVNNIAKSTAVVGKCDVPIDDEIVIFDLETTGLNARSCEIIEIAAEIISGNQHGKTFHTYVKPTAPIPPIITQLTGITDETVEDGVSQQEGLRGFLEFIGDRPVCAHNASFDVSFLRACGEKCGIEREYCSIDTLEMARVLLPDLKKHKLNVLGEHFGFSFNHHRAEDDTAVLAKIYIKLIEKLQKITSVANVNEINSALDVARGGASDVSNRKSNHLIILVKNLVGLKNLYKLISLSHLKFFKKRPIIPMDLLQEHREGLILGSACEAGEMFKSVVAGRAWDELKDVAKFYDFLEIQPIANNNFMIENGTAKDETQLQEYNRTIVKLADALRMPVVATGDVHFLDPEDAQYRAVLMAGMGFSDADKQAPLYLKTTDEMLKEFAYLGAKKAYEVVVKAPNEIAEQCEKIKPVPDDYCPPVIEGSADEISKMANCKAEELYGKPLPEIVKARLDAELIPIVRNGYDVMYLIAQKLVAKSLDAGYLVGSRGSVGSSLIAYLTDITEVNSLQAHYRCPKCKNSIFPENNEFSCGVDMPDKDCPICGEKMIKDGFEIPFATFLGFNGEKAPDIDLNFSSEYQARAHRELINMFGEDHVYKAGTIGTIKSKTAYGFVKKYSDERNLQQSKAEENKLVVGCTGIKRSTGQHPGGLIIVPSGRSIYEFCPVQRPADDVESDIITTHFDYHSIDSNLLKFDMLGHEDPTMIKALEDLTGVDARAIPLDDPDTMSLFTSLAALKIDDDGMFGKTGAVAIPEFGTKFVRGMLEMTNPSTFDELIRISGLSHGTNVWMNNAKDYIQNGDATLKDVISVRDDILTYLMHKGLEPQQAFKISESVRKGRGLKPEWEALMQEHGVEKWYMESCKKIQYMFPRAHAAAYVMMAFRIAWFKVHIPLAFYSAYFGIRAKGFDAAIMTNGDGLVLEEMARLKRAEKRSATEDDVLVTLEVVHEFYKRGFKFKKLDVYTSGAAKFDVAENSLVPPLTSLSGITESAALDIVSEREVCRFMSGEDMIVRCPKVTKGIVDTLEKAGALGDIPKSNQINLFEM